jgi:hypothetical protein
MIHITIIQWSDGKYSFTVAADRFKVPYFRSHTRGYPLQGTQEDIDNLARIYIDAYAKVQGRRAEDIGITVDQVERPEWHRGHDNAMAKLRRRLLERKERGVATEEDMEALTKLHDDMAA